MERNRNKDKEAPDPLEWMQMAGERFSHQKCTVTQEEICGEKDVRRGYNRQFPRIAYGIASCPIRQKPRTKTDWSR